MAGKRNASSDLNHTNWDREEEPEDSGTFKKASNEVLQRRVIKTARRRNPISSANSSADGENKSVFGSFTGFSKGQSTPTTAAFGFLSNIKPKGSEPQSNGLSNSSNINIFSQPSKSGVSPMLKIPEINIQDTDKEEEYYSKLKGLNESVSNWIKKHVDANPFLNLKPIFKDYEKYFDELDKLKSDKSTEDKSQPSSSAAPAKSNESKELSPATKKELSTFVFKGAAGSESAKSSAPQFSFGTNTSKKDDINVTEGATKVTDAKPTFSFVQPSTKSEESKEAPKSSFATSLTTSTGAPTFSFGVPASTTSGGFSFGGANKAPFTFTNVTSTSNAVEEKAAEENDEDEPPKVEFTPVVEDGHIYNARCKVFVKKDNTFGDRGLGNLYLKPVANSEKVQLIVRADTNLGNLLCNFILSEGIPTKRMGKKDVMLVCLPTPESKPPPVPILLRVKSPEDADELLKVLEKHKK